MQLPWINSWRWRLSFGPAVLLRAAAELHRVPSAISYLVRGLESATGLELFDRSKRQAVLTPAGPSAACSCEGVLRALTNSKL